MQESGRETENINSKDGKSPENAESASERVKSRVVLTQLKYLSCVRSTHTHPPQQNHFSFIISNLKTDGVGTHIAMTIPARVAQLCPRKPICNKAK
jgi:hypothetical protein